MSSRKEEERNEKIIRGLMKLPPNRRCINCNSLGPQYVCINFWTFVCTTCSGIHREFTHRVKSVSMSKFTSQEVEALQQGGNQRAREIFLKDWDTQRQRFPDSSNVERIRDFIKNVYVDRKYAGGKTSEKPPKDTQILRNHEDDPRRASSYHSYSQSPPYDYQYEDRRYGKQTGVLSRKPGSDRSLYERKISSFIYSPGRSSEQMYEDRFANEGSVSRASDFSVSSGGDPFRSDTQSPNFQKDVGFRSPPGYPVRDILIEGVRHQMTNTSSEAHAKRDANGIPHRQRMASSGSFGSFDSNSTSLASFNSGCTADVPEPDQSAGIHPERMSAFSSLPQSSDSHDYAGLDLFNASHVKQSAISSALSVDLFEPMRSSAPSTDLFLSPPTTSASSVDLFQSQPPSSAPSVDLFQCPTSSSAPTINFPQPSLASSSPSVDLFADIINQQSATVLLDPKSSEFLVSNNEGWATFDLTQHVESFQSANNPTTAKIPPKDDTSLQKFDTPSSINTKRQQQLVQEPSSLLSNPWHGGLPAVQGSSGPVNNQLHIFDQSRNSFEHSVGQHPPAPFDNLPTKDEHVPAYRPPNFNQCYSLKDPEDYSKNGIQRAVSADRPGISGISSNSVITSAPFTSSALPFVGGVPSNNADRKSSNPFDIPYDSDAEPGNMFLDMNSLQASLPNTQLQPPFLGGVTQPWFPQNSITPYIPVAPQGSLAYMAGQAPGPQLSNVSSQGPVASLGGNPFA